MTKEKTNLSHWTQFLISKKNRCAMWIIGDISACIVILSIILFIIFNLGTAIGVLVSIPLLVLFFCVIYLVLIIFPDLKKCTKLLEDIMKENITDIKKIRDIWFNKEEKMTKTNNYVFWSKACVLGGVSIMVIAFAAVIIVIIVTRAMTLENIEPMGIPISLGIALYSVGLALDANVKMIANANESFLKIFDTFEDKRILFLNQIRKGDFHLTEEIAWKCKTYMKRAFDLMKQSKIEEENRKLLFNQYVHLLMQFPWQWKIIDGVLVKNNVITLTDVQNLFDVYESIRKNHLYDAEKDKPIKLFDPYKDDINSDKSVAEQIDEFIGEINETKKILKELMGEQRRYPFMRLKQATQLLAKHKEKKKK